MVEDINRYRTGDRAIDLNQISGPQASATQQAVYIKTMNLMPTDSIVRENTVQIAGGAAAGIAKARRVCDWAIENTERSPKIRSCGVGDIRAMLESNTLNRKCADLNALFVALLRSVGVPARDVYGIRVADSIRGYKSLGRAGDITRAQHCRAEFYPQGIGWVPVDPADVRKGVLEERPNLTLNDPLGQQAQSMLWSGGEGNWLPYNTAHDLRLPGSSRAPVASLMYPQAENAQGRLDSLDPDSFKYRITVCELS